MNDSDQKWMGEALQLAHEAEAAGEVPVGAVLVIDEQCVAVGRNAPIERSDPTAHAEIQVLRTAAAKLGNYRLPGSTLYVTLEPCAMCAGAMVHARVERLVFGCSDLRGGAAGTVFNIAASTELNHRISVTAGVREDECRALLQNFFRARRQ
jgi:tRNA(adenine34) deaminase